MSMSPTTAFTLAAAVREYCAQEHQRCDEALAEIPEPDLEEALRAILMVSAALSALKTRAVAAAVLTPDAMVGAA
jgi:hypothetical protein